MAPRTPPSSADDELIAEMRGLGLTVTPYQLERWRRFGLLPRVTVRHLRRGGSSVETHPDTTFRAAQLLAMHASRGSSAKDLTWLLVFENLPVTLECLRSAAERAVLRPHAAVARLWAESVGNLPPSFVLDRDRLLDVADLVVDLAGAHRTLRRELAAVVKEVREANYIADRDEIERAARVAMGLRLAMLAGTELRGDLVQLARYGIEHPPAHRPVSFALPFDKLAAARTLTHPETETVVEFLLGLDDLDALPDDLRGRNPLELVATTVALERLNSPPWYAADHPLDHDSVENWRDNLHERLAEMASPEQDPLPFEV